MPDAASYTLSLWQAGTNPPAPSQPGSASGLSVAAAQGTNGQGENQLTVPGDRTSPDFTVPGDGEYRAQLQANGEDNEVIAQDAAEVNRRAGQTDTTPRGWCVARLTAAL